MGREVTAPPSAESLEDRYQQELSREISPLGNVFITLSSVTPASSVFIIVPAIIATAGTGSFLAMVFAAIIGVFMAFCWAELSARFPITAGDYALVWHAFRGPVRSLASPLSFMLFVLETVTGVLIVSAGGCPWFIPGFSLPGLRP